MVKNETGGLCGFFGNSNQQQVLFQSALKTDADAAQF
jgi:hypothetical protein